MHHLQQVKAFDVICTQTKRSASDVVRFWLQELAQGATGQPPFLLGRALSLGAEYAATPPVATPTLRWYCPDPMCAIAPHRWYCIALI